MQGHAMMSDHLYSVSVMSDLHSRILEDLRARVPLDKSKMKTRHLLDFAFSFPQAFDSRNACATVCLLCLEAFKADTYITMIRGEMLSHHTDTQDTLSHSHVRFLATHTRSIIILTLHAYRLQKLRLGVSWGICSRSTQLCRARAYL